ncbi:DUF2508 family protein [Paenibacillus sp. 1001270B_150601_E10]|uniref:DUF2508 family protein n=1 Tax=Paenibacillus sp. 1001270B_150601_E10 TaxID=2787079 RepID=UPI001E4C1C47|nr:DUF2508 family protein [Paenibacillus sp. 1001270B_150601_E10]
MVNSIVKWKKWTSKEKQVDRLYLLEDIEDAFLKWEQAQLRFDMAHGEDEVDYAIFMLEAAEKRLAMLLRRAKHSELRVHYYLKHSRR